MRTSNFSQRILGACCVVFGFSAVALAGDSSCPEDLNGDLHVGPVDLALLLGAWGPCSDPCTPGDPGATCAPDFDGDCIVAPFDLAALLGAWGACPLAPGACCGLEGPSVCQQLTEENCTQAGGAFVGGGTSCAECSCGPGAGDCCSANGTAGCEEANCCEQVCDVLPSCCEVAWTSACANQATAICGALCFTTPANDFCADALPIFDGDTDYANFFAGTDGPAHVDCQFDGRTYHDIWYDYIATCDQTVTVSTCNQADYDTDLVVYDGCGCTNDDDNMLACNDDFGAPCGFTSQVTVPVNSGSCYKIRIGGWMDGSQGTGTVTVSPCPESCVVDPECDDADACTTDTCVGGSCSNNPIECDDGDACNGDEICVGGICQAGTPLNCDDGDACTADNCDPLIGCVYDPIDCSPVNDLPENAIEISNGDTDFDTTGATTDPIAAPGCGFIGDLPRVDVWFDYTATCNGLLKVCTCDQVFWDTALVLYEGCESPVTSDRQVACNDDGVCFFDLSSRMVSLASAGTCYKIRLGGIDDSEFGPGTLTVACLEGQDSNCCLGNPEPGCDDAACEDFICTELDPFCCNIPPQGGYWDDACVQQALFWCDICSGGC